MKIINLQKIFYPTLSLVSKPLKNKPRKELKNYLLKSPRAPIGISSKPTGDSISINSKINPKNGQLSLKI